MNPRTPTQQEKQELIEHVAKRAYNQPTEAEIVAVREEVAGWLESAAVSVFDRYITDSPGYAGKILIVVWSADPSMTETYIWHDGQIANVPICPGKVSKTERR